MRLGLGSSNVLVNVAENLSKRSSGILNFRIVCSKNGSDSFLSGHGVFAQP